MRISTRIFFLVLLSMSAKYSYAQFVGTNIFLQGAYLEIGMNNNASFGACNGNGAIPAGFHPRALPAGGTNNLAEVYDWGHDGWTVGTPPFMGDYTYPGSPFEGWELQIGVAGNPRRQAFQSCAGTMGGGALALTGANSGYSNIGGSAIGTWTGTATAGGVTLAVRQETRVDTFASAVVVTTVLTNTSATAAPNVYYLRSCDPDNTQTWPGGGFPTINKIQHQNEDARHRVLVKTRHPSFTEEQSYMGLGTRDCRAKCFVYTSWWLGATIDLGDIWAGTYGTPGTSVQYTLGACLPTACTQSDIAIGLVFNLGTIAAGDSTVLSYAYIFNGDDGIDSAFPDPQLVVDGMPRVSYAPPTPNYDTFDACARPDLTALNVDILYGSDKAWSWGEWTWAPATGLSATTGTSVSIDLRVLPPIFTYTITGSDSGTAYGSCHNKTFYLTIRTCNGAVSNEPCVGDTLFFNAPGDSLGATYKWFGPEPSTAVFATTQEAYIFPATIAHRGRFRVVKTFGGPGVGDTSYTDVIVNESPIIAVTSNLPNCDPVVDPLNLFAAPDSLCTEFSWVGPGGFTSTLQNPVVSPFDSSLGGVYTVTAVSDDGCVGTGTINIKPGPVPLFDFDRHPACPNDTVFFNDYSQNTATWEWSFGDTKTGYDRNPIHIYTDGHKKYNATVKVTSSNGCTKSLTKEVNLEHTVTANFSVFDDTICNGTGLVITDLSSSTKYTPTPTIPLATYKWEFGDGNDSATWGAPPAYVYEQEGIYVPTLTVTDSLGCVDTKQMNIVVLQPYINSITDSTFCLVQPLKLWNTIYIQPNIEFPGYDEYNYSWSPAANLSSATVKEPFFKAIGNYTYTLTATMAGEGCQAEHVMTLNSILPTPLTQVTRGTKIQYGGSVQLNADSQLYYTWVPNDGSLNNPNINNPIATPTVTTTYTVYGMDKYGCRDTAMITIIVDSSMTEFIPTGFTPNGDGRNDVFRLNGSKFRDLVEMRIYNRWGAQVFYTTTTEQGWDGTLNGVPQDLGVYYYTVILARPGYPDNQVYKGEITLIR